jgi:CDP-glucose 4,6-dehydratase
MGVVAMTDFWTGKRVFGTGLTGFIGTHLAKKLVSLGAEVREFAHLIKGKTQGIKGIYGDLSDEFYVYELQDYLRSFKPEIIFHLAAQPIVGCAWDNPYAPLETNIRGTYHLYHALRNIAGVKSIIHIATDKVFGKIERIQDDSPLLGTGHPYNASKLCGDVLAQMYAQAYGYPVTVIRHANIYGPGDEHWDRIIPRTINCVLQGHQPVLRGKGESTRDYIYVSEIIDAYLRLAELESKELLTVNLGGIQSYSTSVVVSEILELMGSKLMPRMEPFLPGELLHQHIDNAGANALIGWNPKIDLVEGLKLTIPYYVETIASTSKNAEGE